MRTRTKLRLTSWAIAVMLGITAALSTWLILHRLADDPPAAHAGSRKRQDGLQAAIVAAHGSEVYHRSDCRLAANIKRQRAFASTQQAQEAALRPCQVCRP